MRCSFFKFFKDDLPFQLESLEQSSLPGEMKSLLKKGAAMSRRDVVRVHDAITKMINSENWGPSSPKDIENIKKFAHHFKHFLYNLDDQCANLEWIEVQTSGNFTLSTEKHCHYP